MYRICVKRLSRKTGSNLGTNQLLSDNVLAPGGTSQCYGASVVSSRYPHPGQGFLFFFPDHCLQPN